MKKSTKITIIWMIITIGILIQAALTSGSGIPALVTCEIEVVVTGTISVILIGKAQKQEKKESSCN